MVSKRNIAVVVVLLLVVLVVGLLTYKANRYSFKGYSVVYLITGEVYVGKLTTFPDLVLKDGYILQLNKDASDPAKNNFQIQPINQVLWATNELHLTAKNVVFYGPLLPNSKIAETLAAQKK